MKIYDDFFPSLRKNISNLIWFVLLFIFLSLSFLPNHHFKFNAYYLMLMISWRCQLHFRSDFFLTFPALCACMWAENVDDKKSKNFATFVSCIKNKNKQKLNASRSKNKEKMLWLLMILIRLILRAKKSLLSCRQCLLLWVLIENLIIFFKVWNKFEIATKFQVFHLN